MLQLFVALELALVSALDRYTKRLDRSPRGQSTVEYAMVLIGCAGIALLISKWVNGKNVVGTLLDTVFGAVLKRVF